MSENGSLQQTSFMELKTDVSVCSHHPVIIILTRCHGNHPSHSHWPHSGGFFNEWALNWGGGTPAFSFYWSTSRVPAGQQPHTWAGTAEEEQLWRGEMETPMARGQWPGSQREAWKRNFHLPLKKKRRCRFQVTISKTLLTAAKLKQNIVGH